MNTFKIMTITLFALLSIASQAMALSISIGSKPDSVSLEQQAEALKRLKGSAPPAAFEKLSPEQTEKVLLAAIRHANNKPDSPAMDALQFSTFFAFVIACFTIPLMLRNRRFKELQKTIQMMIEKGMTIPTEMVENGIDGSRARRDWHRGVLLLALGGGLIVSLLVARSTAWGIGWIPMCLGGASLYLSKNEK